MWIKVKYFKYVCMVPGFLLLYTYVVDGKWGQVWGGVFAILIGGALGYGVERIWFYVNRHPGGTRLSKFLIGR
jgi:hypothetical protein